MAKATIRVQTGKVRLRSKVVPEALPAVRQLASNHRFVVRRKLACGLWDAEDWRWSVVQIGSKAVLTDENLGDWSYADAVALANDMGESWTITPSTPIENEWGTILSRLRELGWGVKCTWSRNACDVEVWKAGKIHRWSGSPDQADIGFREVALLIVGGDRGVESSERTAPGRRRSI